MHSTRKPSTAHSVGQMFSKLIYFTNGYKSDFIYFDSFLTFKIQGLQPKYKCCAPLVEFEIYSGNLTSPLKKKILQNIFRDKVCASKKEKPQKQSRSRLLLQFGPAATTVGTQLPISRVRFSGVRHQWCPSTTAVGPGCPRLEVFKGTDQSS